MTCRSRSLKSVLVRSTSLQSAAGSSARVCVPAEDLVFLEHSRMANHWGRAYWLHDEVRLRFFRVEGDPPQRDIRGAQPLHLLGCHRPEEGHSVRRICTYMHMRVKGMHEPLRRSWCHHEALRAARRMVSLHLHDMRNRMQCMQRTAQARLWCVRPAHDAYKLAQRRATTAALGSHGFTGFTRHWQETLTPQTVAPSSAHEAVPDPRFDAAVVCFECSPRHSSPGIRRHVGQHARCGGRGAADVAGCKGSGAGRSGAHGRAGVS